MINISPLNTSKKVFDLNFEVHILKAKYNFNEEDTTEPIRYTITFLFKLEGKKLQLKQYNEDKLNKDIRMFCEYANIDYKTRVETRLLSVEIKESHYGQNLINSWKKLFLDNDLSLSEIEKVKRTFPETPKVGPLAFSHMQKNQLKKSLFSKNKIRMNETKINLKRN